MFGLGKMRLPQSLCCLLRDDGYSLVGLTDSQHILFCEDHHFSEPSPALFTQCLTEDVQKYHLAGQLCQVILAPDLYQTLLMDAPKVPEEELSKALRWQLKGLVDYPLNDIVVDAFTIPPHGAGEKRKKVFAAVTLKSALSSKLALIENCLLHVTAVSISELSLSKLLTYKSLLTKSPSIVISYDNETCRHHVIYEGNLYLLRVLPMRNTMLQNNSSTNQDMLLEIQRSIDYCLMELKLLEPKQIFFTPSFYKATELFTYLQTELNKEVALLDINSFFISEPIAPEMMERVFYAIGGALMLLENNEV